MPVCIRSVKLLGIIFEGIGDILRVGIYRKSCKNCGELN